MLHHELCEVGHAADGLRYFYVRDIVVLTRSIVVFSLLISSCFAALLVQFRLLQVRL